MLLQEELHSFRHYEFPPPPPKFDTHIHGDTYFLRLAYMLWCRIFSPTIILIWDLLQSFPSVVRWSCTSSISVLTNDTTPSPVLLTVIYHPSFNSFIRVKIEPFSYDVGKWFAWLQWCSVLSFQIASYFMVLFCISFKFCCSCWLLLCLL